MRLLLLLFIVFSNVSFAQTKQNPISSISIIYPDYTVKADVLSEQKKIVVNENLTYYWYSSNKIIETKGGYDGKVLNGSYTAYYLSKNLKEKGTFKNGLKCSKWTSWNTAGKISEITTWKKGLKNGVYKKYNESGDLIEESNYKNGELNGSKIIYEKGKVVSNKSYQKGVEVVLIDKEKKSTSTPADDSKVQTKKTFKEKCKSLFKKKEKSKENKTVDK